MPSGTFGATGTPTVILFLKKKEENPSLAVHYKNRVDSWFENNFSKDKVFEDKDLLLDYSIDEINVKDKAGAQSAYGVEIKDSFVIF